MNRGWGGRAAVAAALFAAVVELLATFGWWQWGRLQAILKVQPERGVELLADGAALALPGTLEWVRRLDVDDLKGLPPERVTAGLGRLARLQKRWSPTSPLGWLNAARAALTSGASREAVDALQQALGRDPTSPYLHRLRALVRMRVGRYDEALDDLAQAEGLAPGLRRPKVDILPGDDGWVRLEGLRRCARLYPRRRTSTLLALAHELRRVGQSKEARLTLAPVADEPDVQIAVARWDVADGSAERAAREMRALVSRRGLTSSLKADGYAVLAQALAAQGKNRAALEAARSAIEANPRSASPYLSLAALASRRGDDQAALRYMRRAWGVAPADVNVLIRVATVAERAGQPGDARLALERAAALAGDRPEISARLVDFLLRHGDYMEAALKLSAALDRFPTNPALLRLAGRLRQETARR